MIISNFVNYLPLQYQDYKYPYEANLVGIFFALSAASAIPIVAFYQFYKERGNTFMEVFFSFSFAIRELYFKIFAPLRITPEWLIQKLRVFKHTLLW